MKNFLHVGCGQKTKNSTTFGFNSTEWSEVRFDIDENVNPDIIGTMTNMESISSESMDAIYSSHNIEHLYPHEIPIALNEFLRILKHDGFLVITCPDLQSVCQLVADDKLTDAAYLSPAGPIAPIDILYGYRKSMGEGNLYMSHRSGFTKKVLQATLQAAGFEIVATLCRGYAPYFDLFALASKSSRTEEEILEIAKLHFPKT